MPSRYEESYFTSAGLQPKWIPSEMPPDGCVSSEVLVEINNARLDPLKRRMVRHGLWLRRQRSKGRAVGLFFRDFGLPHSGWLIPGRRRKDLRCSCTWIRKRLQLLTRAHRLMNSESATKSRLLYGSAQ